MKFGYNNLYTHNIILIKQNPHSLPGSLQMHELLSENTEVGHKVIRLASWYPACMSTGSYLLN